MQISRGAAAAESLRDSAAAAPLLIFISAPHYLVVFETARCLSSCPPPWLLPPLGSSAAAESRSETALKLHLNCT